jgi:DNA-binding transcriptional LysR family regulator
MHVLAERVARNDLDIAIVAGRWPSGELQARSLSHDDLLIIAPPNSAVVRARALKPNHLESETWLLREEGSDTRREVVGWWHRHRLAPTRTMMFDYPDAVKRAVMAGLGIAMVSRVTVEEDLASRRLASVPVTTSLPSLEFFVVDHPQKHHGAACRAILQLLETTFPMRSAPTRSRSVARSK